MTAVIYHIANTKVWDEAVAKGSHKTTTLETEGFIHCSTLEKPEETANDIFRGQKELVILDISTALINSKIIWEDLYNTNYNFPHIYGDVNLDSVLRISHLECDNDNFFRIKNPGL